MSEFNIDEVAKIPAEMVKAILQGKGTKSIFALKNTTTGRRFTYQIKQAKDNKNLFFVSFLNGPDNWSNYAYIGIIRADEGIFRWTQSAKRNASEDSTVVKAFKWLYTHIDNLPSNVEVWRENKCCMCRRKLTSEWAKRGIGPDCYEKSFG
jgi:hypothetical protein